MVPTRCTVARARKCLSAFAAKMGTERWLVLTSRRGLRGLDQHPRAGGQGRPRWAQPCAGLGRRGRLLALPSRLTLREPGCCWAASACPRAEWSVPIRTAGTVALGCPSACRGLSAAQLPAQFHDAHEELLLLQQDLLLLRLRGVPLQLPALCPQPPLPLPPLPGHGDAAPRAGLGPLPCQWVAWPEQRNLLEVEGARGAVGSCLMLPFPCPPHRCRCRVARGSSALCLAGLGMLRAAPSTAPCQRYRRLQPCGLWPCPRAASGCCLCCWQSGASVAAPARERERADPSLGKT